MPVGYIRVLHTSWSVFDSLRTELGRMLVYKLKSFSRKDNIMNNLQKLQQQLQHEGAQRVEKAEPSSFEDFDLKPNLTRGIYGFGFEDPSLIQRKGIPVILKKRDCIIQGQSGTGKTATYAIAAMQMVEKSPNVQCIILTPTRELADQIFKTTYGINEFLGIGVKSFIGGTDTSLDRKALSNGQVNIAIGTPGRLKQMLERKWLVGDHIKLVILDEADEMINGFTEALKDIFAYLPGDTQVCLVSATMPNEVIEITEQFMKDPTKILLDKKEVPVKGIKQFYVPMKQQSQKFGTLIQIYKNIEIGQCICFANTKDRALELSARLKELKFPISCLTGDLPDEERRRVMNDFRQGTSRILIATDLIGRGIDIQQVNLVINYDLPHSLEKYIHRIGRTGRLGRKGVSINLVTEGNAATLQDIQIQYGHKMEELPLDLSQIYD